MNKKIESFEKNNSEQKNPLKFIQNPILILATIGIIGFFMRIYYFPYEIPLTHDSLLYFWYSIDFSITGDFPSEQIQNFIIFQIMVGQFF